MCEDLQAQISDIPDLDLQNIGSGILCKLPLYGSLLPLIDAMFIARSRWMSDNINLSSESFLSYHNVHNCYNML